MSPYIVKQTTINHRTLLSQLIIVLATLMILTSCSLRLHTPPEILQSYQWQVQGGSSIGKSLNLWLNKFGGTNVDLPIRTVVFGEVERRRRIIGLDSSGNANRYLQETVVSIQLEDENQQTIAKTTLFASRQYAEASDISLFISRLNAEMDGELSRRAQGWLIGNHATH